MLTCNWVFCATSSLSWQTRVLVWPLKRGYTGSILVLRISWRLSYSPLTRAVAPRPATATVAIVQEPEGNRGNQRQQQVGWPPFQILAYLLSTVGYGNRLDLNGTSLGFQSEALGPCILHNKGSLFVVSHRLCNLRTLWTQAPFPFLCVIALEDGCCLYDLTHACADPHMASHVPSSIH